MTVSSGYENKAYDGDNPVKVCLHFLQMTAFFFFIFVLYWKDSFNLQPPMRNTEDTVSIREKVKLSPGEKWRILKNVAILSSAFMVQFTAFQVVCSHFCSHFIHFNPLIYVNTNKRRTKKTPWTHSTQLKCGTFWHHIKILQLMTLFFAPLKWINGQQFHMLV